MDSTKTEFNSGDRVRVAAPENREEWPVWIEEMDDKGFNGMIGTIKNALGSHGGYYLVEGADYCFSAGWFTSVDAGVAASNKLLLLDKKEKT